MKSRQTLRFVAIFGILWTCMLSTHAQQITTDNALTPEELVELLVGADVEVTNVNFIGAATQRGKFLNNSSNLTIAEGIVLSTGDISLMIGPNNLPNAGTGASGSAYEDLTTLGGQPTFDAAVLEFDFIATGDSLSFNFCFGSEEYNEWVDSGFNDVFGLFLDGPGLTGSFQNNGINLAVVPNTGGTSISINSINNFENQEYYIDNEDNGSPNATQMDGFTVTMTASAALQCGETYHIRMCIADGGDSAYDSVVLLEAGSFSAGSVNLNAAAVPASAAGLQNVVDYEASLGLPEVFEYPNGESFPYAAWTADNNITVTVDGQDVVIDAVIIEGCNDAQFTVFRPEAQAESQDTLYLQLAGSAILGLDYSDSFDEVIMVEGQISSDVVLGVVADGNEEGVEFAEISYTYVNGCGDEITTSSRVVILDPIPIEATPSVIECQGPDGMQALGYDNIAGYGPFRFNWDGNEWNNAWQDTLSWTTSFDSVFSVLNAQGNLAPNHTIPLVIVDQCGVSKTHEINLRYPVMRDAEICAGDWIDFPAYNTVIPVADVIDQDGVSLIDDPMDSDAPFTVEYSTSGDRYLLDRLVAKNIAASTDEYLSIIDTCGFETTALIRVRTCEIPNVFTPDSNGDNDNFRIRGLDGYEGSRLLIYNRYGTVVFKDETANDSEFELIWNGRYLNGNDAPEGTYQWVLLRSDGVRETGPLTLIRQN